MNLESHLSYAVIVSHFKFVSQYSGPSGQKRRLDSTDQIHQSGSLTTDLCMIPWLQNQQITPSCNRFMCIKKLAFIHCSLGGSNEQIRRIILTYIKTCNVVIFHTVVKGEINVYQVFVAVVNEHPSKLLETLRGGQTFSMSNERKLK